ncbi:MULTISPECIES: GAF domain-containing protein [Asticcacaulis]|uniref:GAF domain-containing protein n=1 Tax=Asticcacaulis TaxID=76890 RepID=UPI001AE1FD58|nr:MULTISPECIES: GAF domain-containing protein [Asticcacaulis]MBP2161505.1 PAS domain S-box-containing protein [Asticcacaulis solisilvae]MDR6802550.1 PAS domain S-box-containing protein [Asticcacaulis sp. BE141]
MPVESAFEALAGHMPGLHWIAGPDGAPSWLSRDWEEPAGLSCDAVIAQGWQAVFDSDVVARLMGPNDAPYELTARPNQRGVDLNLHLRPIRDAGGDIRGWAGWAEVAGRGTSLQLSDRLRHESDPAVIMAIANRTLGEHLGALRVGYGEIDAAERFLVLKEDWTNGVESNAGALPLASFGPDIVAENRAGRAFISPDVCADPRIGPDFVTAFTRWGVRGLVAVPLIKHGRFTAILSVQSDRPRQWSEVDIRTIEEVAERTWEALERARAEARLRDTQTRQAFLLSLGDRLRRESDANTILRDAVAMLGRHLETGRVGYAELSVPADTLDVEVEWCDVLGSIIGTYPLMSFGRNNIAALARGETVVMDDTDASPHVDDDNRPAMDAMGIRAAITVPLLRRNELSAVLSVHHPEPRVWSESEIRLVEEVAERTWATLERANAEASLRKSEERLRMALEGAELGTWDYDLNTLEGWWSPRTCEIFGIPYTGYVEPELRFTLVHPDDMERYLREVDEAVYAGRPFSIEYRIIRPDKQVRWVVLRGVVHFDNDGKPARSNGISIDVTDRKLAEERLNESQAQLERSREALYQSEKMMALGSLLAGVAHELNNPLAVVVAHATMLEEEAEGTPHASDATKIRTAAERCARIVQSFLAMARQKPPERRATDANALVVSALDLADYSLRTAGVEVRTDLEPDLPALRVDSDQLHQVLSNLIVNAQQAMLERDGQRQLRIVSRHMGDAVEIEIADTGAGVPLHLQRRIFEPFFTTKPQGAGTGIGLSYSMGVVEAHGGTLSLAETSSNGSCFRLRLPVNPSPDRESADAAVRSRPAPARRGLALVIDDETTLAEVLARMLRSEGYEVTVAESGREAQDILSGRDVDLILSDLRMPGMDGPAFFTWLQRERPHLAGRIVFVTGDTLGIEAVRFLARAGRPFIEKPFTRASVKNLLAELQETRR